MAVHQAGGDQRAAEVDFVSGPGVGRQAAVAADPGDLVAGGEHRAVLDQAPAVGAVGGVERGDAGVVPEGGGGHGVTPSGMWCSHQPAGTGGFNSINEVGSGSKRQSPGGGASNQSRLRAGSVR